MKVKKRCLGLLLFIILFSLMAIQTAFAGMGTTYKNNKNSYDLSNREITASIRANAGYLTGSATENQHGSINNNQFETLEWEIDNLYMAGVGFSIQRQWVAIHADYWSATVDGEGEMSSSGLFSYTFQDHPAFATYDTSQHDDTDVTQGAIFDISCELMVPQLSSSNITLGVLLGYKYESYTWESNGGTATDTMGTYQFPHYLNIVTYEQTLKTPYIGLGLRAKFKKFELAARVIGSTFVSGDSYDEHHPINYRYEGDMSDGDMISAEIAATYSFTKKLSLQLGYNYTNYDNLRGDLSIMTIDSDNQTVKEFYDENGSMELDTSLATLTLIYTF